MTPGEQLRAWRTERAFSQSAAAKLAKVNRSSWNATELGLHTRDDYARRILSLTGVDVSQANKRNAPRAVTQSKSAEGTALQQWRIRERLTMDLAATRCRVGLSVWKTAERGEFRIGADSAQRIWLETGILPDASFLPTKPHAQPSNDDSADDSDLGGRFCRDCCDMPHRRPTGGFCRVCGGAWKPDVVECASGLRSASSWMGEPGEEAAE